jgi:fructose-1,6-bisphosphatase/sedoheptulose 1,7-bisphosphatase-like protein
VRTHSIIMQANPYQIRFVDSIHVHYSDTVRVQF